MPFVVVEVLIVEANKTAALEQRRATLRAVLFFFIAGFIPPIRSPASTGDYTQKVYYTSLGLTMVLVQPKY